MNQKLEMSWLSLKEKAATIWRVKTYKRIKDRKAEKLYVAFQLGRNIYQNKSDLFKYDTKNHLTGVTYEYLLEWIYELYVPFHDWFWSFMVHAFQVISNPDESAMNAKMCQFL